MARLLHSNIHKLKLDVLDDDQVKEAVETIIKKEGRIDVLVNNAGSGAPGKNELFPRKITLKSPTKTT